MREGDRVWIEQYLKKLDFVRWDRFIEYQGQQNIIRFFGLTGKTATRIL